ncbi:MAG: hypothetical protein IAE85_17225 [Anaerolinea sp.]|nr:hypothetical protein [Anaerolinea sp.]
MKNQWMTVMLSLALVAGLLGFYGVAHAQSPVISSQNFDGIGTSATATLPTNWRVDKNATARSVGTWATASAVTEQIAGNNMATNAANGIYNYGAGVAASAADRAVGWISSSSATKSGNLYAWFQNDTGNILSGVEISYDVEKYRNGSNAAGFSIQMYYSTDGTTWTSAGPNFLTSFSADSDNSGFATAPGATVAVTAKILTFPTPIAVNDFFYLAWNYSVTTGTTTSNAQGLGIDNFSMNNPLAVALADFSAVQQGDHVLVAWETVSEHDNAGFNLYRADSEAGPQTLLAAIPSQGPGSTQGFAYSYEDLAVQPGQTWYYWLEAVSLSGATTLHGPVSATVQAPTAVTLTALHAQGGDPSLPSTVVVLVALAALAVVAGQRRQVARR